MAHDTRIDRRFAKLKDENKSGLVTFITAGDPDVKTSQKILDSLPESGADFIELGMAFSDPMADGPVIENASHRALDAGITLKQTLSMVAGFRKNDTDTPIILMGYYNPIYRYGADRFSLEASESGVDGLIIVDLPPEEDKELLTQCKKHNISLIRLVTPTTTAERLDCLLQNASGFLYYVSVTGITGKAGADPQSLLKHLDQIREKTDLPIAVGFGIKTPDDANAMRQVADAIVVGSAIVATVEKLGKGEASLSDLCDQVKDLSA
jgi:tryptophan synthase alpha chain